MSAYVGAWSVAHPPETDFFVRSGVQYALEKFQGGLLVSDGHQDGRVTSVVEGPDRPTSLELIGNSAFVVTLTGKVTGIDGVGCSHCGAGHGA